jgi:hypothetical protein
MSRAKRGAIAAVVAVVVVVLGFLVGGGEIWRPGFSAGVCYLMCVVLGGTAFLAAFTTVTGNEGVKDDGMDVPFLPEMTGRHIPDNKAKMHDAVIGGVLEAIKGLVVRSENAEREIVELKSRLSEMALAAGLKPRSTRQVKDESK